MYKNLRLQTTDLYPFPFYSGGLNFNKKMIHFQKSKQIQNKQILISFLITLILPTFFHAASGLAQEVDLIAKEYYQKGLQSKNLSDKIKHFTKALEFEPVFKEAAYQLGVTYYQKGLYQQAIDNLNKANNLDSTDFKDINLYLANACTFLATELNEKEEYELAVTTALQALDIDEKFVPALTILGYTYFNLKDWQSSINVLEKTITLNSNQADVWNKLGDSYLRTEDYLKSVQAYQNALTIDADLKSSQVHYKIAKSRISPEYLLATFEDLKNNNLLDDATDLLKKAQSLYPDHEKISSLLHETAQKYDYTTGVKAIEDKNWLLAQEIFTGLDSEYKDTALKLEEINAVISAKSDSSHVEAALKKMPENSTTRLDYLSKTDNIVEMQGAKSKEPDLIANKISAKIESVNKNTEDSTNLEKEPPKLRSTALEHDTLLSAQTTDSSLFIQQDKTALSSEYKTFSFMRESAVWATSISIGCLLIIGLVVIKYKRKPGRAHFSKNRHESTDGVNASAFETALSKQSDFLMQTNEIFKDKVASITPVTFDPIDTKEILNIESDANKIKIDYDSGSFEETETIFSGIKKVKRIGRYILEKEIGKGSMGLIYKAWDPKLDRTVVIKQIAFDIIKNSHDITILKDRLFREARAAGRLNHPNIVIIYDLEDEGNFSYIVMEYLQGQDLKKALDEEELSYNRSIKIVKQICSALDFAHQNGIVHRDIKPSNIIITEGDKVKVADFGIAQLPHLETITQTGGIIGTPFYMSPEQVEGCKLDGRSDIFSVGVILYEMLTAIHPFAGNNIPTIVYKIINTNPKTPSTVDRKLPNALDNILKRALAKEPDDRYATAKDLLIDLNEIQDRI